MASKHFCILFIVGCSLGPKPSFALGTGTSGGGDAIICGSGPGEIVRLADMFEHELSNPSKLAWFHSPPVDEQSLLQAFTEVIKKQDGDLAKNVLESFPELHFIEVSVLEELEDDHIDPNLLARHGCTKKQLAIQDLEIPSNPGGRSVRTVRINKNLYYQLSIAERLLLQVHEAIISHSLSYGDTRPVRKLLAQTVGSREFFDRILEIAYGKKSKSSVLFSIAASLAEPYKDKTSPFLNFTGSGTRKSIRFQGAHDLLAVMECDRGSRGLTSFERFANFSAYQAKRNRSSLFKSKFVFRRCSSRGPQVLSKKDFDRNNFESKFEKTISKRELNVFLQKMAREYHSLLVRSGCDPKVSPSEISNYLNRLIDRSSSESAQSVAKAAYQQFCDG